MMSENVMQHPAVGDNPSLKPVDDLQQSVANGEVQGLDMLMVMVPGADESLRQNAQKHPENNKFNAFSSEEYDQIDAEVGHKQCNGNAVFLIFEYCGLAHRG